MKDIVSLRNHLFDQLNRLAEASTEELEHEAKRAASIVQVSETIIKSAETENNFIAITKAHGSGFIPIITSGNPIRIIDTIKDHTDKKDLFDVDKEKNWLSDGGPVVQKKQEIK